MRTDSDSAWSSSDSCGRFLVSLHVTRNLCGSTRNTRGSVNCCHTVPIQRHPSPDLLEVTPSIPNHVPHPAACQRETSLWGLHFNSPQPPWCVHSMILPILVHCGWLHPRKDDGVARCVLGCRDLFHSCAPVTWRSHATWHQHPVWNPPRGVWCDSYEHS